MELCAQDDLLLDEAEWHRDTVDWYPRRSSVTSSYAGRPLLTLVANDDTEVSPELFESLRVSWHREYGALSSPIAIASCVSYQKIIALGTNVLPLIIRDLKRQPEPDHWFEALRRITGDDPVPMKDRGNRRRMAKAWLKWAHTKGYA
jgi:hypothetical protein